MHADDFAQTAGLHAGLTLSEELKNRLAAEIQPGERVVWVGVPQPAAGIPRVTWLVALAGWMDLVGILVFMWSAITGIGPLGNMPGLTIALACAPHFLIGPALAAAPLWMPGTLRRAAARTLYVITDARAIVFNGDYFGTHGLASLPYSVYLPSSLYRRIGVKVRSFTPGDLRRIESVRRSDGTTDLLVGEAETVHYARNSVSTVRHGFYSLRDAGEAERLLRELAATSGEGME